MSAASERPGHKGRGALSNPDNRYDDRRRETVDDGWERDPRPGRPTTTLELDASRSVIARNDSPDVPFEQSLNPYRGCEHGCIYCYARPSHAWLGYSPGLDFETRILHKPDAASLLRAELARPGYRCRTLALGSNTDVYQPVERRQGITRNILEVLAEARHPVSIVTKSSLVERDLDLLGPMAADGLAEVLVSITTLDHGLSRELEPRATAPRRRLETLARLREAGVPAGVLVAPVIPVLTDPELEGVLAAAREAGAGFAGYVLLRLPHEVKDLFREWLEARHPLKAGHVMARVRETRGGRDNDSRFGHRMRGQGDYAALIGQRFRLACRRQGLGEPPELDTTAFRPPPRSPDQLSLL